MDVDMRQAERPMGGHAGGCQDMVPVEFWPSAPRPGRTQPGIGEKRMGHWPVGQRGHMGSSGLTGRNGLTGLACEEIKDLIFLKKDFYLTQNSKEIRKKYLDALEKYDFFWR
jgi:hypothetical protein